jgi:hypothetical protein
MLLCQLDFKAVKFAIILQITRCECQNIVHMSASQSRKACLQIIVAMEECAASGSLMR